MLPADVGKFIIFLYIYTVVKNCINSPPCLLFLNLAKKPYAKLYFFIAAVDDMTATCVTTNKYVTNTQPI